MWVVVYEFYGDGRTVQQYEVLNDEHKARVRMLALCDSHSVKEVAIAEIKEAAGMLMI